MEKPMNCDPHEYFCVIEIYPMKDKECCRIIKMFDNRQDAETLYKCLNELDVLFSVYGIISSFTINNYGMDDLWKIKFVDIPTGFNIDNKGIVTLKEEK